MKEKYTLDIAGSMMTLYSEDPEEYVQEIAAILGKRINSLVMNNKRCSKTEAALLCALDYLDCKIKADLTIRNLERQLEECRRDLEELEAEK